MDEQSAYTWVAATKPGFPARWVVGSQVEGPRNRKSKIVDMFVLTTHGGGTKATMSRLDPVEAEISQISGQTISNPIEDVERD